MHSLLIFEYKDNYKTLNGNAKAHALQAAIEGSVMQDSGNEKLLNYYNMSLPFG